MSFVQGFSDVPKTHVAEFRRFLLSFHELPILGGGKKTLTNNFDTHKCTQKKMDVEIKRALVY